MEAELGSARARAKRAHAVLSQAEVAVRQADAVDCMQLEADHTVALGRLAAGLERVRGELEARSRNVGTDLARWRAQAAAAAAAVNDAREELMDRRRELDATKERLTACCSRLVFGREKGMELRGAIDAHPAMAARLPPEVPPEAPVVTPPRPPAVTPPGPAHVPSAPPGRAAGRGGGYAALARTTNATAWT